MPLLPEDNFSYFLNAKKHILVVSFTGLLKKTSLEMFNKCQKEIISSRSVYVIFNMAGLKDMGNDVFPIFSNLQLAIRDQHKKIIICGISAALRAPLLERGIIRNSEIVPTLVEALQKIVNPEAK